jgi:NuA3 HAT complex component NTO1
MQISGRAPELSLEQREKRKLAKRIIKAIQPALEDAIRKESELTRQPFEQELKDLDVMLGDVSSGRGSEVDSAERPGEEVFEKSELPNGDTDSTNMDPNLTAKVKSTEEVLESTETNTPGVEPSELTGSQVAQAAATESTPADVPISDDASTAQPPNEAQRAVTPEVAEEPGEAPLTQQQTNQTPRVPLSPPALETDQHHPLARGGIQWYMQPFDPVGTTIHEERWTGREVMRGLSEELSELDEEELNDLVDDDELEENATGTGVSTNRVPDSSRGEQGVKVHRTRRRWRGFK